MPRRMKRIDRKELLLLVLTLAGDKGLKDWQLQWAVFLVQKTLGPLVKNPYVFEWRDD